MRKFALLALLLVLAVTSACAAVPSTGDSANQVLSAQSQMPPDPSGYQSVPADNIQTLLNTTLTGASLTTGNLLGAGTVNRINVLVECYRDVGAIDFKGYFSITETGGGVVIVINNTRVTNNLIQCINEAAGGRRSGNQAMDASFQPCVKNGTFSVLANGVTNDFSYLYVGSTPNLCTAFQSHFASKGAQ